MKIVVSVATAVLIPVIFAVNLPVVVFTVIAVFIPKYFGYSVDSTGIEQINALSKTQEVMLCRPLPLMNWDCFLTLAGHDVAR